MSFFPKIIVAHLCFIITHNSLSLPVCSQSPPEKSERSRPLPPPPVVGSSSGPSKSSASRESGYGSSVSSSAGEMKEEETPRVRAGLYSLLCIIFKRFLLLFVHFIVSRSILASIFRSVFMFMLFISMWFRSGGVDLKYETTQNC